MCPGSCSSSDDASASESGVERPSRRSNRRAERDSGGTAAEDGPALALIVLNVKWNVEKNVGVMMCATCTVSCRS